jgi:hypothetical protein
MWIIVEKQMYSGQTQLIGQMDKFESNENNQCKNITGLGFAKGPRLGQEPRQSICSNNYEINY